MRARWSPPLVGRLALAAILCGSPSSLAFAEKGAITVDAAAGGGLIALPTPLTATPAKLRPVAMPRGSLSARFSLSHNVALGLALGGEPWRRVIHEGAAVDDDGGSPLLGNLGHSYASLTVSAVARVYLAGFNYRLFLEPRAGWSRRFYRDVEHLRVVAGGAVQSYGLEVAPFELDSLLLGMGLGLEHVWDRAALGAKLEGASLLAGENAWQGGLVIYLAYDFYP